MWKNAVFCRPLRIARGRGLASQRSIQGFGEVHESLVRGPVRQAAIFLEVAGVDVEVVEKQERSRARMAFEPRLCELVHGEHVAVFAVGDIEQVEPVGEPAPG